MRKNDIRKFFMKGFYILLPFVILFTVEIVFLPIDAFTFRVWETLRVTHFKLMSGPFYPNQSIKMSEPGELAPRTKYAIEKEVEWFTDSYGFRNRDTGEDPEIVLIGDSNIVGAHISQDEILSEVLGEKLQMKAYSFAPIMSAFMDRFLAAKRFQDKPPKIVVYSSIERNILKLRPCKKNNLKEEVRDKVGNIILSNSLFTSLSMVADRIMKWPMYRYSRSKILRTKNELSYHNGPEFFIQGDYAVRDISEDDLKRAVNVIKNYKNTVESKGMRFIYLPIPNKENIYHRYLESKKKPVFLTKFISELKANDIDVVDTQSAFERAYEERNTRLYFQDDGHWNEQAIEITSDLIVEVIQSIQNNDSIKYKTKQ